MATKRAAPLAFVPVVASTLLGIGVMTAFSACGMKDDGTWMRCHDAQLVLAALAAVMAAALLAAALLKGGKVRAAFYALGAAGSVVAFFIPGAIVPMCMMQTMRCYEVMQPFARIMAVVVFASCIVCAVRAWRSSVRPAVDGR